MNVSQVKEVLSAISYPVKGADWEDVLADLHCTYGAQKVGTSITRLGDASSLYVKSGNIAFMVDNAEDLRAACIRIQAVLKERESKEPVTLKPEVRSRFLPDITTALENEIDIAFRVKRDLGIVNTGYEVKYDLESRTQTRKPAQILDDLLSDDKQRNAKAVEALKSLLIIDRGSVTQ